MSNVPLRSGLSESEVDADPMVQFGRWYEAVQAARLPDSTAMTLATATSDGAPSARIVLLKGYDAGGFVFYTNYAGRKGRDLLANPRAALLFYWTPFERQVRVEGSVVAVPAEESDAYFHSRPRDSRVGAWASEQSAVIPDRAFLETRFAEVQARFGDGEIPRPPHWGGFRVVPDEIEFWQAREHRLHDRLRYRQEGSAWVCERLSP